MTFQFKNFDPDEPNPYENEKFWGWLEEGEDWVYRPQKRIEYYKQETINILTHYLSWK